MANAIKLLTREMIFTKAQSDDKQVCLSSSDDDVAQDLTDFKTALGLTANDIAVNTTSVTTTTHNAAVTDNYILANDTTAGGAITITLPLAATAGEGRIIKVKKLGNTANVVVDGNGAETIDGGANVTLTTQYESVELLCNGSAWFVF